MMGFEKCRGKSQIIFKFLDDRKYKYRDEIPRKVFLIGKEKWEYHG